MLRIAANAYGFVLLALHRDRVIAIIALAGAAASAVLKSRAAWQQTVQDQLQENFGLREHNLFRNVVLIQPLSIGGSFNQEHNRKRSLVAQQLEKIGDTIIRYSDLAAKRCAENS